MSYKLLNSMDIQSMKDLDAQHPSLLCQPWVLGSIQHIPRPCRPPNAEPNCLVPKQSCYSFYLPRRDERMREPCPVGSLNLYHSNRMIEPLRQNANVTCATILTKSKETQLVISNPFNESASFNAKVL